MKTSDNKRFINKFSLIGAIVTLGIVYGDIGTSPLYVMEIGVPTDSYFKFAPITIERPILVYGTSIAQGASASRPAMAWSNILQRRFDMPVINLGFSGNALMDPAVYDLISEVDARMGKSTADNGLLIGHEEDVNHLPGRFHTQRAFISIRYLTAEGKLPLVVYGHLKTDNLLIGLPLHIFHDQRIVLDIGKCTAHLEIVLC